MRKVIPDYDIPFSIFRPEHLSASTVNKFIDSRSSWFLEKVMRRRFEDSNASFARGNAIEHGLDKMFQGVPREKCIEYALKHYNEEMPNLNLNNATKFLKQIPEMLTAAMDHFSLFDKPYSSQEGFEIWIENWKFLGYLDYRFHNKTITDLKTASTTPNSLTQGYKLQGTIYQLAYPDHDIEFVFIIPLVKETRVKTIKFTLGDMYDVMPILKRACQAMDSFYEMFEGMPSHRRLQALKDIFMPSPSEFWNHEECNHAFDVMGISYKDRVAVQSKREPVVSDKTTIFDKPEQEQQAAKVVSTNPFLSKVKRESVPRFD